MLVGVAGTLRAAERGVPDNEAASEVFRLLNDFRSQHDKDSLQWNEHLAKVALEHAYLCAEHGNLSHQYSGEPILNLRLAKFDIRLNRAGENLSKDSSVQGAHEGLVLSPPHRANMLSPDFNAVGIAVVRTKEYYYVVEDFAHVLPETSTAEFEAQIGSEFDRLRAKANASPVARTSSSSLRKVACEMAESDELNVKQVSAPGARYVLAFTITEPQRLPPELIRLDDNRDLASYAVGACFASSQTYPNGTYWVLMAIYAKGQSKYHPE